MTKLFWIRSQNLGDALNPLLHKAITGKEPIWTEPGNPGTILAIGSLAHCAHPGDILWGTGAMADDMELQCDKTTEALAIRGPLTAWMLYKRGVNLSNTIFADPAILVPRFFPHPRDNSIDRKILIVPHYADCERAIKLPWNKNCNEDCLIVSPMKHTETLIHLIAEANSVITSSLHSLIVAEAYNVPAVWVEFSGNVRGNGYKFVDWYLSTIRNPPSAIQIRDDKIPWNQIYDAVYDWTGSGIDLIELGDLLLEFCPFDGVV